MNEPSQIPSPPPRLVWPWFMALAVLVAIVIATLAVRAEAQRIKAQRLHQSPAAQ